MVGTFGRNLPHTAFVALAAAVSVLVIGLVLAPQAAAGDPCYHGFDIPSRTEAAATEIKVGPCFFGPTVADVPVGATVTFFNGPVFTHLITGANAEWGSRDVELKPEQTVSYTFGKPGVYPYACALHRGMSGTIVVGDVPASGPAAGIAQGTADSSRTAREPGSLPAGPTVIAGTAAGMVFGAAGLWLLARRREVIGRS